MHHSIRLLATLLATVTIVSNAPAQDLADARDVVQASFDKTGGPKWAEVKSMVQTAAVSIQTPQGAISGSGTMTFMYPGYLHVNMLLDLGDDSAMPMSMTQVMTPDTGYVHSDQGNQPLPGGQGPDSANEDGDLLQSDATMSMEVADLNGSQVYKVTVEGEEGAVTNYYDQGSLQKVAKESATPMGTAWTWYDDYKEVSGVMLPHKITQELFGGVKQVMTIRTVNINPMIDRAALFGPDN